jgi:prevent-host-death family protein
MSRQHSIASAKNNLPALVHEAELGDPIEITRRGQPVAVLLSMAEYRRLSDARPDAWERLQTFRANYDLAELDIAGALAGTRDASPGREVPW